MIDLSEDDPDSVERMLQYLYTGNYDDTDDEANEEAPRESSSGLSSSDPTPSSDQGNIKSAAEAFENDGFNASDGAAKAPLHVKASALANHLLVYSLADYHDIPLLKNLARTKFEVCAAGEWAPEDIISILPKVYATTPESDRGLRQVMFNVCMGSYKDLMCHEGFRTMQGDASMCFDLLDTVRTRREEPEINDAIPQEKLMRLKRVIKWTKVQEQGFKQIALADSTCRNCSRPMDFTVGNGATSDWHGPFIIKCRHCRLKFMEISKIE
ncbi:MAG: hypothetical protein Q9204_007460 [Flavoplaca sp. TL-2023a]